MISLSDVGLLSCPVTNAIPASLTICLRDVIRKVIRELRGGRLPSVKPRAVDVERSKLPTSWKVSIKGSSPSQWHGQDSSHNGVDIEDG